MILNHNWHLHFGRERGTLGDIIENYPACHTAMLSRQKPKEKMGQKFKENISNLDRSKTYSTLGNNTAKNHGPLKA